MYAETILCDFSKTVEVVAEPEEEDRPKKVKRDVADWEDDDDDWDDDDEDDDWDDDDDWEENEKDKIVCVRFQDTFGDREFSRKRYAYFSNIEDLKPGDWVMVKVQRQKKFVRVVATEDSTLGNENEISKFEKERATKYIIRRAEDYEVRNSR